MNAGTKLPGTPKPSRIWRGWDGNSIAGDTWGNPSSQLVMLLHGGGQTRHAWKGTGEMLGAHGYFAVAIDARGHGDSDWSSDGMYSQEIMALDLLSVLKQLHCSAPVLVGASMGGITSLLVSGEPQNSEVMENFSPKGLVMVDIAPKTESKGVTRIGNFMTHKPEGFDSLEEVAEWISAYQPHRKKKSDLKGLAKNLRLNENGKYCWHWDPRFMTMRKEIQNREERLNKCTRALSIPTLLVRGGLSDILSEEGARDFLQQCGHAKYVNITDAAHMVAGDRNDIFGQSVLKFLSEMD